MAGVPAGVSKSCAHAKPKAETRTARQPSKPAYVQVVGSTRPRRPGVSATFWGFWCIKVSRSLRTHGFRFPSQSRAWLFATYQQSIPEHPCPNQNYCRVPRASGHQSVDAQSIIKSVFQEHTHPCPNHSSKQIILGPY